MNELSRRTFVKGVAATAPLALVLGDPRLAAAVAAGLETVTITTADGRKVKGALAMPAKTPAPTVLLIHEWWGLNDQIKSVAAEFAKLGYLALALDLYDGKLAKDGDRETASGYRKAVKDAEATATVAAWVKWLKKHNKGNGKVGTIGWCFGGGWSLNASIAEPVDATVVYYGAVTRKADDLKKLKGPVLGHFGTKDQNINKPMVDGFEAEMKKAGKPFTTHWYEADHAFANPTGNRYNEANAKLSWQRTQEFFAKHLKG